jgi:hypothetical protein
MYAQNDHSLHAMSENEVVRNAAERGVHVPYPRKKLEAKHTTTG